MICWKLARVGGVLAPEILFLGRYAMQSAARRFQRPA